MTNPHFKYLHQEDSALLYELSDESISMLGIEIEYLPRTIMQTDVILNEPLSSQFNDVFVLDATIDSTEAFFPGNEVFGPAGLMFGGTGPTLSVSRREFMRITKRNEPNEGDLVFIKENRLLFEIQNVNTLDPLISGGRQYVYTLYLMPYTGGEGHTKFTDDKFKMSPNLDDLLEKFKDETEQNPSTDPCVDNSDEVMVHMDEQNPDFAQNAELENDTKDKIVPGSLFGFK